MRVLVIGSTGYVGSRVIPALRRRGHEVVAGARDVDGLDRFEWADDVTAVELDVLDDASVDSAIDGGVDAIVYLVHGMGGDDFMETDRRAAETVRDAADRDGVPRIVYVSGIIPAVDDDELSEHLTSRLEVERILSEAEASVVTLRAAMVMGAGSTSFELMAQLAQRLPVTVVPDWMRSEVEPIAVVDLVAAVVGAVEADVTTQHFDVGGGETMPYPDLIDRFTDAAGTPRPQIGIPLLPEPVVAKLASWIADVPSSTVVALMESLQEDMVAADRRWIGTLVDADYRPLSLDEALARSLATGSDRASGVADDADDADDAMRLRPGDPEWATAVEEAEPEPEDSEGPEHGRG